MARTLSNRPIPARGARRARGRQSFLLAVLAIALLLCIAPAIWAATYSFHVPTEALLVRVNTDASADFWYTIDFNNDSGGVPIDIVDIGMPNTSYTLADCSASIDGAAAADIRQSTVVTPGVEVHLPSGSEIQPGKSGKLQFHGKNAGMVYTDTSRAGYASFQFKNTWWDSAYAHGDTALAFSIQFPNNVKPNETVYHNVKPTSTSTNEGSIVFSWNKNDAKPYEGYVYGVSFPAVYVTNVYPEQPLPDYTPAAPPGTNYSSGGSSLPWSSIIVVGIFVVMTLVRALFSARTVHKRGTKVAYIKPAVGIEGTGPMKGLLPAEAAVVMEQDLDRVTAIVFFEMLQKGVVGIDGVKPLRLAHESAASLGGTTGEGYYPVFLSALTADGEMDKDTLKLALQSTIKDVENKVRGFSPAETAGYYKDVAKNGWAAVSAEKDPKKKMAAFDKYLPWLLLEPDFGGRVRGEFSGVTVPAEGWVKNLSRVLAPETGAQATGEPLADALASGFLAIQDAAYVQTEKIQPEIVKEVYPEEYRRVYRRPMIVSGGGGGGGGGGCACACACAGCACACAGGGR